MKRRVFIQYINLGDSPGEPEIAVTLVVDDSGSMAGNAAAEVRAALREFISKAPEGARLGLTSFGETVKPICEPTEYREFLLDQLEKFTGSSGCTALWDAVGSGCESFKEGDRHRYVLVLTDGGENATKTFALDADPGAGKRSVIEHAANRQVRVLSVGFGNADAEGLRRLGQATGGTYIDAGDMTGVVRALLEALRAILDDRRRVRLRPEVARLLGLSGQRNPPWVRHFSVDPWSESRVWSDGTHILHPMPGDRGIRALVEESKSSWLPLYGELTDEQIRSQAQEGAFPQDANLVIVGWLADPLYRAFSIQVLEEFRRAKEQRLVGQLPGTLYPVFVPLLHETGRLSDEEKAACAAWLTVARGVGPANSPRLVLPCAEANSDRSQNPVGWTGSRDDVLCHAAQVIRALVFCPGLCEGQQPEDFRLTGVGSVAVDAALGDARLEVASVLFNQLVRGFCEGAPQLGQLEVTDPDSRFAALGLGLGEVKARLIAPLKAGDEETILAAVRLDEAEFIRPPEGVSQDEHYYVLVERICERAEEYLSRKRAALEKVLARRSEVLLSDVMKGVGDDIDKLLLESENATAATAQEYLERFAARVARESDSFASSGGIQAELERMKLFAPDEMVVPTGGFPAPRVARERLEKLLENRPLAEAMAVRHVFLGLATAAIVAAAGRYLSLGDDRWSWWGLAAAAAVAVGVAGVLRWRVYQQRLLRGVHELVWAWVQEARNAAKSACTEGIQSVFREILAAIGSQPALPAYDTGSTITEDSLTERQRVTALAVRLKEASDQIRARFQGNPSVSNRFVWNVGTVVRSPVHEPSGLDLRGILLDGVEVKWDKVSSMPANHGWREVCRRKRCDDLKEYVEFHSERLQLPQRFWRALCQDLSEEIEKKRGIGELLANPVFGDRPELLKGLRCTAFPTLRIRDGASVGEASTSMLIEEHQWAVFQVRADKERLDLGRRFTHDLIDTPCELHWVMHRTASPRESVDWEAFGRSWAVLSPERRQELLREWGLAEADQLVDSYTERMPSETVTDGGSTGIL